MLRLVFAMLAAIGVQATPTPWHSPPVQVLTAPVVLARGTMICPGDERPAKVELWMMSGEAQPLGCVADYIVCGRVALQVQRRGHAPVRTGVNELVGKEEMCFDPVPEAWPLAFGDFNHDGAPDLALGEHTCHEFNGYYLLSFSASGEAHRLPIAPGGVMWAPAGGPMPDMSEVEMTANGFRITMMDRTVDPIQEQTATYHWDSSVGSFFVFTTEENPTPPR